jgi:hypothetical protein
MCILWMCTVYSFPPAAEICARLADQFLPVVDNSKVRGIYYGLAECLIFHSYGSYWGEEEWGTKLPILPISLHYLAQGEGPRGRERGCVAFPPLASVR